MNNREGLNERQCKFQGEERTKTGEASSTWPKPSRAGEHRKTDFFEKLELSERELTSVEKECSTVLYSRRSEFRKDYCALEDLEVKATNERKTEKQHLKQQLGRIQGNVQKFQRELMDVKPSPAFVEKLKEMMEDIEGSIMAFKEQQRKIYDELLQEERTILQELTAAEKKFDSWSQLPAPATTAVSVNKAASTVTTSLPPAVAAFERFLLQTAGHLGGWEDYDHQLFLKLKAKHKNAEVFMRAAGSSIPGKSADDVRQHNDWYSEYLMLKENKRKAITEWKYDKQSEKQELLEKAETEVEEEDTKRRKKEEQLEQERVERVVKLSEYKVQKQIQKAKLEEVRLKQHLFKAKEKEKEEKRRLELKARVDRYALRRAEEEEVMRVALKEIEAQERLDKRPTTQDMERVQERNLKMLEEKQAKMKAKEVEKEEKEKRLQKLKNQVEVKAERDPSRLYKLTRGLEERRKEGHGENSGGPALHMPHRAVPSWRQGLS